MSDIVERLRNVAAVEWCEPMCAEAADEITRLRAALDDAIKAQHAAIREMSTMARRAGYAEAALAEAQRVPPGWKLVPVETTDAMIHQGAMSHDHPSVFMGGPSMEGKRRAKRIYSAMLAAAPQPPEGNGDDH